MIKDEALRLALKALEGFIPYLPLKDKTQCICYDKAIIAIKEALETKHEPVAYFNPQVKGGFYWAKPTKIEVPITVNLEPMPLYTTPQHTWVALTDEEIEQIYMETINFQQNARALEAKLKERNT